MVPRPRTSTASRAPEDASPPSVTRVLRAMVPAADRVWARASSFRRTAVGTWSLRDRYVNVVRVEAGTVSHQKPHTRSRRLTER
jgi:hypothetical protein